MITVNTLKTNSRLQQSQLNFHYSFNLIMIHILLMVKENYAYNKTKQIIPDTSLQVGFTISTSTVKVRTITMYSEKLPTLTRSTGTSTIIEQTLSVPTLLFYNLADSMKESSVMGVR